VGEGGAERSSATGEGFLRLGELYENILQNGGRSLQHVIVPVTRDPKTFGYQNGFSRGVTLRVSMLATIDFDDDAPLETDKVENKVLKGDLATKLVECKSPMTEQAPHGGFGVRRFATHLLCEIAGALGGWSMVWCLRHEPLTRHLTS
jgi:hypothetical protein